MLTVRCAVIPPEYADDLVNNSGPSLPADTNVDLEPPSLPNGLLDINIIIMHTLLNNIFGSYHHPLTRADATATSFRLLANAQADGGG